MEYNIYLWLSYLVQQDKNFFSVKYEPDRFNFRPNQYHCTSYVPDFKIITTRGIYYIEVKGFMDFFDAKKIELLHRDYPWIKLKVIGRDTYNYIKKAYRVRWE